MDSTLDDLLPDGKFRPFAQALDGPSKLEIAFAVDSRSVIIRRNNPDTESDEITVPVEAWSAFVEDVANGNFRVDTPGEPSSPG